MAQFLNLSIYKWQKGKIIVLMKTDIKAVLYKERNYYMPLYDNLERIILSKIPMKAI
jgi:hypothetical protein